MDTSSVTSTSSSSKESNDSIVPPASSRRANGRGVASSSSYQSRATTVKTSKYRGVSFLKGKGLWRARIEFDGKRMHLGCFKNEDDAARKYDEKSYELHGQKGVFNFPDEIKLKCAVSSTTSSTTTTTTTKNVSNTTTSSPPVTESRALSPPSLLQRSMSDSAISSSVPSPVQQQQQQQLHQQYAASALSSLNRHQNNFDFISNDQLLAFSTADLIVSNDRKKSRARDDKDSSNSNDSSKAAPLKRQRRATPLQLSSPDCETQIQQILVKNTNATNTNQDSTTTASTNTIASKMQCPSKGAIASAVAALAAAAAAATTIPATSPATISSTTISSGPLSKPSFNSDRTASNTIPAATPRIQISPSDSIMSQFSKISPSAVHPSFLSSYLPASSQIRLLNNNNCNTNTNTNNNNGNGNCNPNINNGNSNNNSSNHGNNSNSNSKNQSPSLNQLPDSSHFQMSILSSPLGTSMLHSNGLFAAHNQLRFPPSPMDSSKYCTTFLNPYMASASTSPLNLGRSVNLLNPLSAAGSLYFQDPSRYPLPRSIPVSARANNGLEYCQSTSSSNQQHLINSRTLPSQSAQSQESNSN